ncbi:MAG: glycoside hydrolase domain-containing protein, partial [Ignavibacteriaceae bacterium]
EYVIGSPCVNEATINLENGKVFKIISDNLSKENVYISEIKLNGKNINRGFITQDEIINGGELKFIMTDKPNKNWAVDKTSLPYSMSN